MSARSVPRRPPPEPDPAPQPPPEPPEKPEKPVERPAVPVTPIRRLLSLAVAGFAGLLGVGLVFGAQTAGLGLLRIPYAIVILGIQVLLVFAFTMALRPPSVPVVALVGLAAAVAADVAAVAPAEAEILPLAYVAGAGFVLGVGGQLLRRAGRMRVTEVLSATLVVVMGVTAYATLIVLTRVPLGTQAITVCLVSASLALVVARLADTVAPWPRLSPLVPRGAPGVVLGPMLGTVAASFLGGYLVGFDPTSAALAGLVTAVAAVLADLSVGYAEAGRKQAGETPTLWIARHLQGPLAGFAVAAPLAYLLSAGFFVGHYG